MEILLYYIHHTSAAAKKGTVSIMKEFKGFKRGINLGGWLSQCSYEKQHMESFISEEDFRLIAEMGADHVRLPFDYNIIEDENSGFSEEGFGYIDFALEMCRKYGLNIVLDLHKAAGFSFDKGEQETGFFEDRRLQQRFLDLWEEMAKRYGGLHEFTAFELLNEVTDQSYINVWNDLVYECIARIRKHAPETPILVGSYWNNSVDAVKALRKPYDDRVVYNFHCYSPLEFTHQGAYWTDDIDPAVRMSYKQSGWDSGKFMELFREALEFAAVNNTVLYCGEYGVIDVVSPEDTLQWYRDIHTAFENCGIARCAWCYKKMDFGITDTRLDSVRNEIIKSL